MRNIIRTIFWSMFLCVMASCHSEEPAPAVSTVPRAVLVYMVADNSLGINGNDAEDLAEMQEAATAGDLGDSRLIVYHAGINGDPILMEITSEGTKTLKSYTSSDLSVSAKRMSEVISDFKGMAPARNYSMILWSHASGWLQNGVERPAQTGLPNSFGDDSQHYMNITTLSEVLDGNNFDYLYFDCCYMANIETVYQLRNVTNSIVGSATELPADGMPYDATLRYLMPEHPDLESACRATFNHYNSLSGMERTCTISLIDTSAIDELADLTNRIYSSAHPIPQGYEPQQFMLSGCYLFDFRQYVEAISSDGSLTEQWNDALRRTVPYCEATPYVWSVLPINHHCGLSTNILNSSADATTGNYYELDWWSDVASSLFN